MKLGHSHGENSTVDCIDHDLVYQCIRSMHSSIVAEAQNETDVGEETRVDQPIKVPLSTLE